MIFVGAIVLIALLVATVRALTARATGWLFAAAVLAVLWPFVNGRWEGPVLWVPLRGHGLTVTDLLTPVVLMVLAVRVLVPVTARVRRPGTEGRPVTLPPHSRS